MGGVFFVKKVDLSPIKWNETDGLIFYFTFYSFGGCVRTQTHPTHPPLPTGLVSNAGVTWYVTVFLIISGLKLLHTFNVFGNLKCIYCLSLQTSVNAIFLYVVIVVKFLWLISCSWYKMQSPTSSPHLTQSLDPTITASLNPTRPDPTHGWTQPMSISEVANWASDH